MRDVHMRRAITITLSDEMCQELRRHAGDDEVNRFVAELVRQFLLSDRELEADYQAMAAGTERERAALEWIEAAPDDALVED